MTIARSTSCYRQNVFDQQQTLVGPAPWWRDAVVYQIYVRSFADADADGVGDLAGIADRLDHLRWLGVDAVWLTPFFASPQRDLGYDITDHCAVDPLHGTQADFDRLLERAHGLGLRVILDLVPNHTSVDHRWFTDSRSSLGAARRDWYWWHPGRDGGRTTGPTSGTSPTSPPTNPSSTGPTPRCGRRWVRW
jgi:glycosidase